MVGMYFFLVKCSLPSLHVTWAVLTRPETIKLT